MIKFFEKDGKLNAVDDKNRLVGFDLEDDCCAHGGWFVSETIHNEEPETKPSPTELEDYEFDPVCDVESGSSTKEYDDYSVVIFRMKADGKPDLYLHLYNCHNGYYSKGFESSFGPSGQV